MMTAGGGNRPLAGRQAGCSSVFAADAPGHFLGTKLARHFVKEQESAPKHFVCEQTTTTSSQRTEFSSCLFFSAVPNQSVFIQQAEKPKPLSQAPEQSCESKLLEGSTSLGAWLAPRSLTSSLGQILACLRGARTLPPKLRSRHLSGRLESVRRLLSRQRPTYRPHQSRPKGCQTPEPFSSITKTLSPQPILFHQTLPVL